MSQSQNQNRQKNDLGYWIAAIILLTTGLGAPIGILMIALKLLGGGQRGRHPYYAQQQEQSRVGAHTAAPGCADSATANTQAAPQAKAATGKKGGQSNRAVSTDFMSVLAAKGKKLTTVGGIIAAVFSFVILATLSDSAYFLINGEFRIFLQEAMDIIPLACFLAGGLGCLWAGIRKSKQARRYRSYLAMIGSKQAVTISSLSAATGCGPARVREDLTDMLNDGIFPTGFLDYSRDTLVLSGDGLIDSPAPAPKPEPAPAAPHQEENAILAELRAVNDAVANQKLSAQIDQIGMITAKILEYQKNRPEKAPQLHSFLSYYLPTTLKILRAYGQLESQEISGENITAAMQRIEGMMDKVVEGFEKQLDQLFQGDAMDITTDVQVLERMLAKDGLSFDHGMTLGL